MDLYLQLLAGHLALRQLPQAKFLINFLSPLLTAEQREGGSGSVPAAAGRSFGTATAATGQIPNKYSLLTAEQREGGSGPVPAAAGRSFGAATAATGQIPNKYSLLTAEQREGGSGPVPAAAGRSFGAATAAAGQVPLAADTQHLQGGDPGAG